jgi:hypothetical protein
MEYISYFFLECEMHTKMDLFLKKQEFTKVHSIMLIFLFFFFFLVS